MKAYKIYSKSRGLYSKGGSGVHLYSHSWSKKGKTWSSKAAVVLHLNLYNSYQLQKFEEDFIIKEFDFDSSSVVDKKVSDFVNINRW